jgi:hypothetical protein
MARRVTAVHPDWSPAWTDLAIGLNGTGATASASDVIDRAVSLDPNDSFARRVQCEVLVSLERWKDALAAVESARAACGSSFKLWSFLASETAASVAILGAGAAMEVLSKALAGTIDPETASVIEAAQGILSTELQVRGPVATARALGELRAMLARHHKKVLLADVFTAFVSAALGRHDAGSGQWAEALPMFESAVADLADCRVPMEMLSAGTRYRREGDETILLSLPLEQRTLLREALGLDKITTTVGPSN